MTQYPTHSYPPPAPPQPTNGLGLAGFIVSLVGFFFGCLLCPVGLLLSFIALFKRPRGFAIAGFILGAIGSIIPLFILSMFGLVIVSAVIYGKPGINTFIAIEDSHRRIDDAASKIDYALPTDAEGNAAIASQRDGWGHPFRYRRLGAGSYELRSAGPDGVFDTSDDLESNFPVPNRPRPE